MLTYDEARNDAQDWHNATVRCDCGAEVDPGYLDADGFCTECQRIQAFEDTPHRYIFCTKIQAIAVSTGDPDAMDRARALVFSVLADGAGFLDDEELTEVRLGQYALNDQARAARWARTTLGVDRG